MVDPFDRNHKPVAGVTEQLAPGVQVVTAPNPGPMTFTGTRSYIVGDGDVAVIDPGPGDAAHLSALADAVAGRKVRAVLVTHAHRDHSEGAPAFSSMVGAPVIAHGDAIGARSATMAKIAGLSDIGGSEGLDTGFRPDQQLTDDEEITGNGWTLTALHTPGHLSDHFCFGMDDIVFSGDLAMGWSTTLISPPGGELAAFRASIARIEALQPGVLFPGHGAPVSDPQTLLTYLIEHRAQREAEILAALADGPADISGLVARIYVGLDPALVRAAGRNVLAHLIDLMERRVVRADMENVAIAGFSLI